MLSFNKLDELMNPNVHPKFFNFTPEHYKYNFQSSFAIAGIENLKSLETKINSKIEKVKLYENYLDKRLRINYFIHYKINSFLEFPILLKKSNNKFLSKELLKIGYDIRRTWYVNSIRYLKPNSNFDDFYNCEYLHKKVLSLPTHDQISEKDIIRICELINFHENDEII